ncbi:MAG: AAA family ATPase, partial [Candidatus Omnitrophota bacterium]
MNSRQFKIYFQSNYKPLLLFGFIIFSALVIFIVSIIATLNFIKMDSIFQQSMWAGMLQTLLLVFVWTVTGLIQTLLWVYLVFGGGFAQLTHKKILPEHVQIRWSDVIGMTSIKTEVWEAITLLKERARMKSMGAQLIKGIILLGPPGCGKTYLAKAIATETKLPFLHKSGSDFQGMFIGMGTSRIRSLFKEARIQAEVEGGCLIFLDEIDTIARPRMDTSNNRGGQDYNATVNQLLTELDGLGSTADNIIVIAATNVPESELDSALMRPGRFDRKVHVDLPSLTDREKIIEYYLNKIKYDKANLKIDKLARLTVNHSSADIANIVRESALIATRKKKSAVTMDEINEARERISLGIKMEVILSEDDKKISAYHEA